MSIVRHRLLRLLTESPPAAGVVLLVAPPGYGKTVLLEQLAQAVPVTYVSLARVTSHEGFVRELIGAVAPHSLPYTGDLFGNGAETASSGAIARWVLERLRGRDATIVLDDLAGIAEDRTAMGLLASFIDGTRGRVRWMLASRTMPSLPVSTWVARSLMGLPITERDLAFTRDDAQNAARAAGATIGDGDLDELLERHAGWPIGMQLALEAWNRFGNVPSLLAATRQQLFAYLQNELWLHVPAVQREVIVACALVRRISAEVLDAAGYADAGLALTALERRIPLVTRLPDGTYALHEVFRGFVLDQVASDAPLLERMIDALGPALARTGRDAEALALARCSGQHARIVAVIAAAGMRLIDGGARELVEATLAALPVDLNRNGVVRAMRGAVAQNTGRREDAEREFAAALATHDLSPSLRSDVVIRLAGLRTSRLDADGAIAVLAPLADDPAVPNDRRSHLLGLLAVSYAIAARGEEAAALLTRSRQRFSRAVSGMPAPLHRFLALTYFYLDRFDWARRHAHDALTFAQEVGDDRTVMSAYSVLLAIAESDDLDPEPSRVYAREIVVAGERLGDRGVQRHGLSCQLMIAARAGDAEEVARYTAALDALGGGRVYAEFGCAVDRAVFYAAEGDFERARTLLRGHDGSIGRAEEAYRESLVALFDIASGRPAGAHPALAGERLPSDGANIIERRYLDDAQYCRALALWAAGRPVHAQRALPRGDALGRRGKLILDAVAGLIALPHPVPNEAAVAEICNRLQPPGLGAFGRLFFRVATIAKAHVELSRAEIELLAAFAASGGRTADVARAMHKSPHTVRNQMRSVCAKIGCSGRNEAIAYARQRGWLAP